MAEQAHEETSRQDKHDIFNKNSALATDHETRPADSVGDTSLRSHALEIRNPRIQSVQRQALAAQVGQVSGNRHLQRMMSQMRVQKMDGLEEGREELKDESAVPGSAPPILQPEKVVQRYSASVPVTGMGTGTGSSKVLISTTYATIGVPPSASAPSPAYVDFTSGMIEAVKLAAGTTSGTVHFTTFETAHINNLLVDDIQWGSWKGTVPFTVSGDTITFGDAIITSDAGGSGATMSVSVGKGSTPGGGYTTFALTVAASGSTTLGGSIGLGPISGSAPTSGTSNFAGGFTRSFTVNLRITPPSSIAGPDVSFKVGKAELEDGQEGEISAWFEGLPAPDKEAIINGRRTISISGYASRTGKRKKNRDLSEKRARVVERILRGHVGSIANLNIFFLGEDNATTPDEVEDPRWRRATIVAQAPTTTGPGVPGAVPAGTK